MVLPRKIEKASDESHVVRVGGEEIKRYYIHDQTITVAKPSGPV